MSMLSMLIDRLRTHADLYDGRTEQPLELELQRPCLAQELRDAADTIWQLRDDLQRANAENAKLRSELESVGIAAYLYGRTDLAAENAKLRELVALWSVINKHMSLCATIDCEKCPVREECRESVYLEGLLGIDSKELSWRVQERMSELGIEVDG